MKKVSIVLVVLFVAVFAARPAGAQTLESINKEKVTKLKEVVVTASPEAKATTASKTDTPIQDIPASVVVIPQELIQVQAATNVDESIRNVSGVTQSSSSNYGFFNNYVIRGLNMNFLRDGVPDASTINGYSRSLVDVERIEILKGPGSALYGSSAPGGSVNLISKVPQEEPEHTFSQSLGSFGTAESALDLTGPTRDQDWLYRLNVDRYTTQGFRDLSKTRTEFLPTLLWKANEGHQVTIDFDYRNIDVVADTYGIPFQGASLTQENKLLDVPRENKYYTPFAETNQEIFRGAISDEKELTDMVTLRNNLVIMDRDLYLLRNGGGTVAAGSSVMTGRSLREQSDDVTDYIYQLEPIVDFNTGLITHKLLTGYELQYHDITAVRSTAALPNITDVYNPVVPESDKSSLTFVPNFDRDINAVYHSLYAQDQIDLTDQWKARAGVRTDWFDTKDKNSVNGLDQHQRDNELSGQAGLVYEPIEDVSFYVGGSSSKQAILSTEASILGQPESAEQIEIGNKTTLFDDKLSFGIALYRVTRKDFLVTIGADTIPVGKQRTQGAELDLSSEPVKGWKLYSNYSLQEAELLSVPQAGANPSVDGNRPTGTPVHSSSFWSTYELQEGRFKGFGFGGGLTFKGDVFINQQNTSRIPSYVIGDVVFFYHKDWYETQLNITNIADTTYYRNGVNSGALPGDPLAVLATMKAHF